MRCALEPLGILNYLKEKIGEGYMFQQQDGEGNFLLLQFLKFCQVTKILKFLGL